MESEDVIGLSPGAPTLRGNGEEKAIKGANGQSGGL